MVSAYLFGLWLAVLGGEAGAKPLFESQISEIPVAVQERMRGRSFHPGCPVPLASLRLLSLSHWNDVGEKKSGEIIVHEDVSQDVVDIFRGIFEIRFPIHSLQLVHHFDGDDDRSMEANNTSGFNCRPNVARPKKFSKHSYGRAIDINPLLNPYVRGAIVKPRSASAYVDRKKTVPGMIFRTGGVVQLFRRYRWSWGGRWRSAKDYQHFEKK